MHATNMLALTWRPLVNNFFIRMYFSCVLLFEHSELTCVSHNNGDIAFNNPLTCMCIQCVCVCVLPFKSNDIATLR